MGVAQRCGLGISILSERGYCNPLSQHVFQGACSALLHIRKDMGVGIEGYSDGRVPEHFGDNLRIDVTGQEQS